MGHCIHLDNGNTWIGNKPVVKLVADYLASHSTGYPKLEAMLLAEKREVQESIGYWDFSKLELVEYVHIASALRDLLVNLPEFLRTWNPQAEPLVRKQLADLDAKLAARIQQLQ